MLPCSINDLDLSIDYWLPVYRYYQYARTLVPAARSIWEFCLFENNDELLCLIFFSQNTEINTGSTEYILVPLPGTRSTRMTWTRSYACINRGMIVIVDVFDRLPLLCWGIWLIYWYLLTYCPYQVYVFGVLVPGTSKLLSFCLN